MDFTDDFTQPQQKQDLESTSCFFCGSRSGIDPLCVSVPETWTQAWCELFSLPVKPWYDELREMSVGVGMGCCATCIDVLEQVRETWVKLNEIHAKIGELRETVVGSLQNVANSNEDRKLRRRREKLINALRTPKPAPRQYKMKSKTAVPQDDTPVELLGLVKVKIEEPEQNPVDPDWLPSPLFDPNDPEDSASASLSPETISHLETEVRANKREIRIPVKRVDLSNLDPPEPSPLLVKRGCGRPRKIPHSTGAPLKMEINEDEEATSPPLLQRPRRHYKKREIGVRQVRRPKLNPTFPCGHGNCKRVLRSAVTLQRHIARIHSSEPQTCPVEECGLVFSSLLEYREHVKTHGSPPYLCEICSTGFHEQWKLNRHQLRKHQDQQTGSTQKFPCKQCGKIFRDKYYVRNHELLVHGDDSALADWGRKPKLFQCTLPDCTFRCVSAHLFALHEARHRKERNFRCSHPGCSAAYNTNARLKQHNLVHTGERPHSCPHKDCTAAFRGMQHLQNHIKVKHEKSVGLRCDICGEGFPIRKYLVRHLEKHKKGKI